MKKFRSFLYWMQKSAPGKALLGLLTPVLAPIYWLMEKREERKKAVMRRA